MWMWDMHVGCRHHVGGALRMWGAPGGWGWGRKIEEKSENDASWEMRDGTRTYLYVYISPHIHTPPSHTHTHTPTPISSPRTHTSRGSHHHWMWVWSTRRAMGRMVGRRRELTAGRHSRTVHPRGAMGTRVRGLDTLGIVTPCL